MKRLWLGVFAAALIPSLVIGVYQSAESLYENGSCSQPAYIMKFNSSVNYCQADHFAPVCEYDGSVNSVTDCIYYYPWGWDSYGLLENAFGTHPYLIVEKYKTWWSWGWCGDDSSLDTATAYLLDEKCHMNREGKSTKLTIGRTITIMKYSDPSCITVSSQKTVTRRMATDGSCDGGTTIYRLRGPSQGLTTVAVFADSSCSATPVKLTFTQGFVCSVKQDPVKYVCGPDGSTYYSVSSCTSDYSGFAATIFGDHTLNLIKEEFADSWCGQVQSAAMYTADGLCHTNTDDATSFRATLLSNKSATITTYTDVNCTNIDSDTHVTKRMVRSPSCNANNGCISVDGYGCSTRISVGGLGAPPSNGKMTAVSVFDDSSCSQPAGLMIFTREITCLPQVDHYNPVCEVNGTVGSVTDCTYYYRGGWDNYNLLYEAFSSSNPYLIVEKYDTSTGSCGDDGSLDSVAVYLLDEGCHTNQDGTLSFNITLGHVLIISEYDDPTCTVVSTETTVTWAMAMYNPCSVSQKFYLRGSRPKLTVVSTFDDSTCSETPVKVMFTQDFICHAEHDLTRTICGPDGSMHFSISNCTNDHSGFTDSVFGSNNPYLMVEEFADSWCGQLERVTVYVADGSCHTNPDDATSFRAKLTLEGVATITTYSDTICGAVISNTDVSKRVLANTYLCISDSRCDTTNTYGYGCSKRITYGGLGDPPSNGMMTAFAIFDDSSCSQPAKTMTFSRDLVCTPQPDHYNPVCKTHGTMHSVTDCIRYYGTSEMYSFVYHMFGLQNSHLVVEEYDTSLGWCGSESALDNVTIYRLDDECHLTGKGTTSSKLTFDHSLTITKYDDPDCMIVSKKTEVTWASTIYSLCTDDKRVHHLFVPVDGYVGPYGSHYGMMTAATMFDDDTCFKSPVQIMFTQDFLCGTGKDYSSGICQSEGSTHYSVLNCTKDFRGFTDTVFNNNPFFIVVKYVNPWCGEIESGTAYIADGLCHTNIDNVTSFMATLTPQDSAIIVTYVDTNCGVVKKRIDVSKRTLAGPSSCNYYSDCDTMSSYGYWGYWGCSTSIAVGGLGGPPANGWMTAISMYSNSSCSEPAVMITFTRELVCTPQMDHYNPTCTTNETIHAVQDCTSYHYGGWDDFGLLNKVFYSSYLYLVVEEYDTTLGSCGNDYALDNVTIYLLDEECHMNLKGSSSSKLTLGHTLTISKYDDPYCKVEITKTVVTWAMVTYHPCVEGKKLFSLRGPLPKLSVVSIFDDSNCSEMPVKITFTKDFMCHAEQDVGKTVCGPNGSTHFSISNCTDDYSELTESVFGNNIPHLIVENFGADSWCGQLESVTVYAADDSCHTNTDNMTSFRAMVTLEGVATLTTFSDTVCDMVDKEVDVSKQILARYLCNRNSECETTGPYGCSKRFSVGGLGGPPSKGILTVVSMYDNSSCSQPAGTLTFTRELTCMRQADHYNPICETNGIVHSVTDCDYYYRGGGDTYGLLQRAFGSSNPYLVVEKYATSRGSYYWYWNYGDDLDNATAYLVDKECHTNRDSATSSKVTFNRSITISRYTDPHCTVVSAQTEVTQTTIDYGWRIDDTVFHLYGGRMSMTAVLVFDTPSCWNPVKLTSTIQEGLCTAGFTYPQNSCWSNDSNHYSYSRCTDDYTGLASSYFYTVYFMIEEFSDKQCGQVQNVTVYKADGSCHSNIDGATSFRATFTARSSAEIITYSDTLCSSVETITQVSKRMLIETTAYYMYGQSTCSSVDDLSSRRFSVKNLWGVPSYGEMTATSVYDEGSCSQPAVSMTFTRELFCTPRWYYWYNFCQYNGLDYSVPDCTKYYIGGWDNKNLISQAFGSSYPYLIVEDYDTSFGSCGSDNALDNATVYLLDEECHANNPGVGSTRFSINQSSLVLTKYDDFYCTVVSSEKEVTYAMAWYSICVANTTKYYIRSSPGLTATAIFDDSTCSQTPTKLTFSQGFVCGVAGRPTMTACGQDGSTHYSISTCTTDFNGLTTTFFGTSNPYIIVQEFADLYCNLRVNVVMYTADGFCHTNTDDSTSFRATLIADDLAKISTYTDPLCRYASNKTVLNERILSSNACFESFGCNSADGYGCSKMFSIGGLGSLTTTISKTAVVIYDDSFCAKTPVQIVVTNYLACTSPKVTTCQAMPTSSSTVYQSRDCSDNITAFAASNFGRRPYLFMEKYSANCGTIEGVVVYAADSKCHPSITDDTSFKISPNVVGSVTMATYSTDFCSDSDADYVMVGAKYINTGACFQNKFKIYVNLTAMSEAVVPKPAPTVDPTPALMCPPMSLPIPTPTSAPTPIPTPEPTTKIDDINQKTREQIMFPAWLWEPTRPRAFVSPS